MGLIPLSDSKDVVMGLARAREKHWYVGFVKQCMERKAADLLRSLGYEYYLPIQKEMHQWSDRKKMVERLVIPRLIFVRCIESDRIRIKQDCRYIYNYMTEKGPYTAVIIPDAQMESFRSMVETGRDVRVSDRRFSPGEKVRVTSGNLKGMVCELITVSDERCLAVRLNCIGTVYVNLAVEDFEIL